MKYFLIGDPSEEDHLTNEALFFKKYFSPVEKIVFDNLNKKFNLEIRDYKNLIELKKSSDYREDYILFEEHLDRFQENIFKSEVKVFYSQESSSFVNGVEGQILRDVKGFNKYLKTFYDSLRK